MICKGIILLFINFEQNHVLFHRGYPVVFKGL